MNITLPRAVVEAQEAVYHVCLDKWGAENGVTKDAKYVLVYLRAALQAQAAPYADAISTGGMDPRELVAAKQKGCGEAGCAEGCCGTTECLPSYKAKHAAAEPVTHEFQWTNPSGEPGHLESMFDWEKVVPLFNQTVEQKIAELEAYRFDGKPCYRVRALYTTPPTTQEAMRLALEALKRLAERDGWKPFITEDISDPWKPAEQYGLDAIAALESALPDNAGVE